MAAPLEKQVFYSIVIGGDIHNVTGRKRTSRGYVQLCIKTHPNSDVQGYIFEHRVVMEMKLGRYLTPDEDVHHINENKKDNRIENLMILSRKEHSRYHGLKRIVDNKHNCYKPITENEIKQAVLDGGTIKKISKRLDIDRTTFYNKLDRLNLRNWYKNWRNAQ